MTGFNLQPGCSVSDLPGNTPQDQAEEAAHDRICEQLEVAKLVDANSVDEEWYEQLVLFIMRQMGEAYGEGYKQGQADERFAAAQW